MIGRTPNRSIARPRKGAAKPLTAANDKEALISARLQPKLLSSGAMKRPNPYCDAPTESAVAANATPITIAPCREWFTQ